jgi:trans-aconitate 2-methyltransferase
MNSGPREWDAETYDAVSDPQFSWGMEVLGRLELRGDETVLDAGCGSGRVTAELAKRLPAGHVIAVDGSEAMIAKATARLGDGVSYLVADLSTLELEEPVDLVFSTATFHWILDHDRLFERLRAALHPGGRLVAQCGGEGNVAEHARVIATVAARPEFAGHFGEMTGIWNFASAEETESRLRQAGFSGVSCWLEPRPVKPEQPLEFTSTVTLGPLLARLPQQQRRPFAEAILEESEQPLVLDYVRLNIEAVAG